MLKNNSDSSAVLKLGQSISFLTLLIFGLILGILQGHDTIISTGGLILWVLGLVAGISSTWSA